MLASPSTLEAMANLYNQRMEKQGGFMEAMKDAAAWTGGGIQGPTETLKMRDEQRSRQASELFSMQNQIAQHRQAMKMADAFLGTTQPTAAAQGATATDQAAPAAGGRTGGLLDMVKDPNLKRQIGAQYLSDPKAAMGQLNKYLMETGQTGEMARFENWMVNNGFDPQQIRSSVYTKGVGAGAFQPYDVRGTGGTDQQTPLQAAAGVVPKATGPVSQAPRGVPPGTPAAAAIRNPAPPQVAATQPGAAPKAAPGAAPAAAPAPQTTPATMAPSSGIPGGTGFKPGTKEDLSLREKLGEAKIAGVAEESKEVGKEAAMSQSALNASGESAGARLASIKNINNILDNQKNAAGPLSKPGMLPAVLTVIERGISAGNFGQVGMPGIESAVRQLGGTQEDIDAAQELGQEFAKIQLANAKTYLKGQGAVSDAERELIRQMSGKTGDSPNAIRRLMQLQKLQAEYEQDIHNDWINWQNNNRGDFTKFKLSPEYRAKVKQYSKNLDAFAERPRPSAAKPAAQPGAKKSLDSHPGRALLDKYPKR
jgi:hypothetical protein